MKKKEPRKTFLARFEGKLSVPDAVACDTWTFTDRKGRKHTARQVSMTLRISPTIASTLAVVFLLSATPALVQEDTHALRFSVTDTRDFTFDLSRDLIVSATRAMNATGQHFGWDLSVRDRRIPNSPNFFYDCLCGHGPRANDLYAWHFTEANASAAYPSERTLPVFGYPYTVRVVCENCEVAGKGYDVRFVSGTVSISWTRLPASHPRQLRISDIVKRKKDS